MAFSSLFCADSAADAGMLCTVSENISSAADKKDARRAVWQFFITASFYLHAISEFMEHI